MDIDAGGMRSSAPLSSKVVPVSKSMTTACFAAVSMVGGAAFLVLADVAARTVQSPAEVPIGVITAVAGAPFFLFVLRSRRARQDLA